MKALVPGEGAGSTAAVRRGLWNAEVAAAAARGRLLLQISMTPPSCDVPGQGPLLSQDVLVLS